MATHPYVPAILPEANTAVMLDEIRAMSRAWDCMADADEAVPVNFERFAREWEDGAIERDQRREQIGEFFDEIRDRQKAEEWGIPVEQLPWRMRARLNAGKAILV
jgi:hypothetical protein